MMYFLIGWLTGLTLVVANLYFRSETTRTEVWKTKKYKPTNEEFQVIPNEYAAFIENDRVNEIIKGKPEVRLDDILL